jgi:hypothetical protein
MSQPFVIYLSILSAKTTCKVEHGKELGTFGWSMDTFGRACSFFCWNVMSSGPSSIYNGSNICTLRWYEYVRAVAAATTANVAVERTAVAKKRSRHNRDPLKQPKKALKRRLGIVKENIDKKQGRQCQLFSRWSPMLTRVALVIGRVDGLMSVFDIFV